MVDKRILSNDKEIDYAREFGVENLLNLDLIPCIKRINPKNRIDFKLKNLSLFVNGLNGFINQHPDSEVISFVQFNKGDIKSLEEFNLINEIQLQSNLNTFVLQEISLNDTLDFFKKNVLKYKSNDREKFLLIEIESADIEDKIKFAISNGISNFIIRAGDYFNTPKWTEVRAIIRKGRGLFIISLPKRMDKNRISYFRYSLSYGCDYTFHEKPVPFPVDNKDVLNINDDFVYVKMQFPQEFGVKINKKNIYDFSRVRTLIKAQELSVNFPVL
jgi:hypothetical protein